MEVSELYQALISKGNPPVFDINGFVEARLLPFQTANAVYVSRSKGKFPVRIREMGGKQVIFLQDVAEYLFYGVPQTTSTSRTTRSRSHQGKKRAGRPSKAAQVARREAALAEEVQNG